MTKSVVVTGAGTGIGQAIARILAEKEYALVLLGRNRDRLETTRSALKNPGNHQSFSCDIRRRDQIRGALEKSGIRSLYAVVANAGMGGENHYAGEDPWQEILDTNLTGSYHTINECLPFLKKNTGSYRKIVIISSILARLGVPGYSAYCASKAGLLGLMRSLAAELTGDRILVNAVCPGWVNTDMAHQGLQGFANALKVSKDEAYRQAMSQVPLGKMSEPEEVAQLVAFLVSDAQVSCTGQTFDINNGALMP
ncbi:MAG: SDR family NAD(P)-dependent oxidoreductase [Nitrospinaceae bacterium]